MAVPPRMLEHSVAIQLIGLPGVLHVTSHLTMKKLKVDG